MNYPKRLIEVDLPIKRISAHSRREKSIRHGHISTLHIWWARRPLAACRAVLCASLWPDPADPLCPAGFLQEAEAQMLKWSDNEHLKLLSRESIEHFIKVNHDKTLLNNKTFLRQLLLDFIADFSNWDNSNQPEFLSTSRKLTEIAHIALGGEPGTKPMVVDPFAGGGSIPLEALRIGTNVFASDLNPIPVLINKVQLEHIPIYGKKLANEYRKWCAWIKQEAEKELTEFYPKDPDNSTPIAYLWARTISCEGPACGAEVPLIRSLWLAKKNNKSVALKITPNHSSKKIEFEIIQNPSAKDLQKGTVQRGNTTCPVCGFTTPVVSVRRQLKKRKGGANDARLLCVVTTKTTEKGRFYRLPTKQDFNAIEKAGKELEKRISKQTGEISLIPNETLPIMSGVFNAPIYGMDKWSYLFTNRQLLALTTLIRLVKQAGEEIRENHDKAFADAIQILLAFLIDKVADYGCSASRWLTKGEYTKALFSRQAIPMVWDFAESSSLADSSGSIITFIDWVNETILNLCETNYHPGVIIQCSATSHPLPDASLNVFFTDPPYYNAVPYADLSDFFYVWLKRTLSEIYPSLFIGTLAPKDEEICEMAGWDSERYQDKNGKWFEYEMQKAMSEGRRILRPDGIGIVVFAHKTTAGWEAQLQSMIDAGWVFTGSWPIDTEMGSRLRAINSAALASSIHLVCRPRENKDGSLIQNQVGDWRDILLVLPKRIHEWMPRLASEGVVGADAIFSCLGPALEIYSKYSSVEKPNGDKVELKEYLEQVWAAVSQEAISMVFSDADARTLEEDARITAMWLWTLSTNTNSDSDQPDDGEIEEDEEETPKKSPGGFYLEYDTARKIAQGLGARIENMRSVVEIKGDKARLLPVEERTKHLFGMEGYKQKIVKKKKEVQLSIFPGTAEDELSYPPVELKVENTGKTTLDRLHQAMLLFAASRSEALKRFLVEDGIGKDDNFWKLAQALNALYPQGTNERRWVEGVQTFKKGLGY